ncbi:MAG: hypothetical protein ABI968_00215 [Acidobacteriota bacterium]
MTLVRFAFVQPEVCAVAVSVAFETIATTRQSAVVVVAPGIVTLVLAVLATSPAVMSHGLPDVMAPRKVMICP